MENTSLTPAEAAEELAAAQTARGGLRDSAELPPGYDAVTGLANVALAYGIAVGNTDWRFGTLVFVVVLMLAALAIGTAVTSFRRHNGTWVSGLHGSWATKGVLAAFLAGYGACVVAATAVMLSGRPVLAAVVATVALPITVLANRRWMALYRADR